MLLPIIKRLTFLIIIFHAPMGKFQLESELKLPLFSGLTVVPFNWLCWFCRPFVSIVTSSASLVGCFYPGRVTEETFRQPTKLADDVATVTKDLQDQNSQLNGTTAKPKIEVILILILIKKHW